MGASTSRTGQLIPPEDIVEFRKLTGPTEQYVIPERSEKRRVTDFKFTVVFAICLIVLVPFLIYTFVYSDLDRVIHGYDKCGNVCGQNNSHVGSISCSGQDKTNQPYLTYKVRSPNNPNRFEDEFVDGIFIQDECVSTCDPSYVQVSWGCFPKSTDDDGVNRFFEEVRTDINRSAGYIVVLCFIGFGLCVGTLFLFRYFVDVVVWFVLVFSLLGFIALTIGLWVVYGKSRHDGTSDGIWYLAVFFTILSAILIVMLICMFKRIKLIIRLFQEAIKVIFGIPLILFEPVLTFVASFVLLLVFIFFLIVMSSSGFLQLVDSGLYEYAPNSTMMFTIWYHIIICLWMAQFIIGCQHMVISGAVSAYYFARDKSILVSPIYTSFYNLIRYHLGTVAFGSLIITVVAIIKALIRSLTNSRTKILVDCCLGMIEDFLKYLTKNAYIQTAMHGQSFYKSGKRAVRLLAANALSTITVNSVGDFILCMVKLMIILCTLLVGIAFNAAFNHDIKHFWAAIVISVLVTAVVADCFFSVYETAIDTIFLCFCEDSCMNDGMERPYYMTTNLMQYMEEVKKTGKKEIQQPQSQPQY